MRSDKCRDCLTFYLKHLISCPSVCLLSMFDADYLKAKFRDNDNGLFNNWKIVCVYDKAVYCRDLIIYKI